MVNDFEILEHLGDSDHNIIVWKLICDVGLNTNNKLVRKYHKADYNSMRDWHKCIDWAMECSDLIYIYIYIIYIILTVDEMWLKYCSIIDRAIHMFVPLGQNRNRKIPSWMKKSVNSARKYKSTMWNLKVIMI